MVSYDVCTNDERGENQQCHIIFMEFYQKSNVSQCYHVAQLCTYGQKKLIRELLHHHTLVGTLKDWENIYVVKNIIVNAHCSRIVNKFPRNILFCIWCQPVDINYPLYFDTDCTTKSSVFFPFLSAFRIKCKFLQDKVLPDQITLLSN